MAVIPLFASLVVGLLMFLLLGRPLAAITSGLTTWLGGLSGGSVILLGVILGLMMCFDLGGPVTGALIMALDVTLKAPHGGIFVFFAIGKLLWCLVALAAGTVVGALAVIAAKQFVKPKAEAEANAAFAHN